MFNSSLSSLIIRIKRHCPLLFDPPNGRSIGKIDKLATQIMLLLPAMCLGTAAIISPLGLYYLIWTWFDKAPENGGRPCLAIQNLALFKYVKNYFALELVKTRELDPSRSYLIGYHPHGKYYG
jgi:hypothetical protein